MALINAVTDEPTGWRRMSSRLDYPCYHAAFAGGACLFRARAFREAGGYGTAIEGCGEEFDLTVRLYAAGWAVLHFPAVEFHHFVDKDDGAWREQLCRGYRHLQYTVRRLYPGAWSFLAGTKSLLTHLVVDLRLHGGGDLGEEIAGSHRWWARGGRERSPVSRRALERLYFAKYYRVEDWETLRRAPAGLLWRVPWLRLRRKLRRTAKLDLPRPL
jgi:GT2 family glycosyltransferase